MLDPTKGESSAEIEDIIIQAFGFSIIEFEKVLFHRFLNKAGPASVITEEQFHKLLVNLQAKGFIAPMDIHGMVGWKKLIISWNPDLENLGTSELEAVSRVTKIKRTPPREGKVSESRIVAKEIMTMLEDKVTPEWNENLEDSMSRHAEEMRKALSESQDQFIQYLNSKIPKLKGTMLEMLEEKGEDILLLSLRLIAVR